MGGKNPDIQHQEREVYIGVLVMTAKVKMYQTTKYITIYIYSNSI